MDARVIDEIRRRYELPDYILDSEIEERLNNSRVGKTITLEFAVKDLGKAFRDAAPKAQELARICERFAGNFKDESDDEENQE